MNRVSRGALAAAVFAVFHLLFFLPVRAGEDCLADECAHTFQILRYAEGDWSPPLALTTIPGYHLALGALSRLLGLESVPEVRFAAFFVNGLALPVLAAAARSAAGYPALRAAQLYLLPNLFPFFFLVYTDALSTALVLLSFALLRKNRPVAAGFCAAAAITVRQSNVLWLAFLAIWDWAERRASGRESPNVFGLLRRYAVFAAGLLLFAVFFVLNRGVSVTHKDYHPPGLYFGNLYFALFAFFVFLLPVHLACFRSAMRRIRLRKALALLAAFFAVYFATFTGRHPHNQKPFSFFLRNKILLAVVPNAALKAVFFVPVAGSVLSLAATKLESRAAALLYPFSALFLSLHWLIEPRYSIVPMCLFLLFRRHGSRRFETVLTLYLAALSAALYYVTFVRGWTFP